MNKRLRQLNGMIRGAKIMVFFAALMIMAFIGLLWFLRPDTSTIEKRSLTEFPSLTWTSFWDGSFFSDVDTWYADTYPLREGLISANQSLQAHYGIRGEQIVGEAVVADDIPEPGSTPIAVPSTAPAQPATPAPAPSEEVLEDGTVTELGERAGTIYITNNAGYGLYGFIQEGADSYAATMNQIYENIKDKVDMYVMVCPISAGVMLDQSVLDDMGCSDEGKAIDYMYGLMNEGIHTIDAYDNLRKHNAEYIYFHTDHHWTQLGAYYAYEVFCQEKGITPHDPEDFETLTIEGFLGTFYSSSNQSAELAANPDTVEAYIPKGTNSMTMTMTDGAVYDWNIVNDVSHYPESEFYAAFAGGDQPFNVAHNENITDGSAVLVIKDSYGNAFIPWLVDHYEYIYWIDYRYTTNTVSQMVEDYGVQDVIFETQIYNATGTGFHSYFAAIGQ